MAAAFMAMIATSTPTSTSTKMALAAAVGGLRLAYAMLNSRRSQRLGHHYCVEPVHL